MRWIVLVFSMLVLVACGNDENLNSAPNSPDGGTPDGGEPAPPKPEGGLPLLGSDCDPMVPDDPTGQSYCGLPFPSNVYLLDDPTGKNPSGKSVRFGETTLPKPANLDEPCRPDLLYDHDGFSTAQAPMTHLPRASADGCATPHDLERSLDDDSPTVLLEAETGRRVPHWVDVDTQTKNDGSADKPDQRLVMLRPAERLKDGTRYIVAIRDMHDVDGVLIQPSAVFRALRDSEKLAKGTPSEVWSVYARRDLYTDIFQRLDKANVDKSNLQIAWDYTTASKENTSGPMIDMRDQALSLVGDDGPTFTVESVTEYTAAENPRVLRRIELIMDLPVFLTTASIQYDSKKPLDRLNFGSDGKLVHNGSMPWKLLVVVPRSVESGEKHGLLQNGHGLFGSRFEGANGYLAEMANRHHWIAFATNLFGFDEDSVSLAADGLFGRCDILKSFPERQVQGMVNQLLAMRMMMGRVAKDGIKDAQGKVVLDSAWIDPSVRAYRGDSQGGIMGAVYMSVSTDVTRGLLGEPGMPYNLLLPRSVDFDSYAVALNVGFGFDGVASQLVLGLAQMSWDKSEPSGFAPYMTDDPFPNTPPHHVLLHVGRGDHQVTTYGAHILARAIGAAQLESDDALQPVWDSYYGIDQVKAPIENRSLLVEYEFGLAENPDDNQPNEDGCDPHDRVRVLDPSYDQPDQFFRTGVVDWFCKGACNCSDSASPDPDEEGGCDASFVDQCE
jgi:hypothetical protein